MERSGNIDEQKKYWHMESVPVNIYVYILRNPCPLSLQNGISPEL